MPMLDRVTMVEPLTGRICAVMLAGLEDFEKRGYKLAAKRPSAAAVEKAEAEAAPAEPPDLAVESRAFEKPHKAVPVRRRKSK